MSEHENWINRFTNLWLACEKDPDLVHSLEPIEEKIGSLIRQELNAGLSRENIKDQEKWLEKFASLWLASKKTINSDEKGDNLGKIKAPEEKREGLEIENNFISRSAKNYTIDIQAELEKGKVIVGDSSVSPRKINTLYEEGSPDLRDAELNPDDLIVFDIDPEMAIKLLTSSKGKGL